MSGCNIACTSNSDCINKLLCLDRSCIQGTSQIIFEVDVVQDINVTGTVDPSLETYTTYYPSGLTALGQSWGAA